MKVVLASLVAAGALVLAGGAGATGSPGLSASASSPTAGSISASWSLDGSLQEFACQIIWSGAGDPLSSPNATTGLSAGQTSANLQATPGVHYYVRVGTALGGSCGSITWSDQAGVDVPAYEAPAPPPPAPSAPAPAPATQDPVTTTPDTTTPPPPPDGGTTTTDPVVVPVAPALPAPPVSDFTGEITGPRVVLTSAATDAAQVLWLLGDGTTSTSAVVAHAYQPGIYEVALIVINPAGLSALSARTLVVSTDPAKSSLGERRTQLVGIVHKPVAKPVKKVVKHKKPVKKAKHKR